LVRSSGAADKTVPVSLDDLARMALNVLWTMFGGGREKVAVAAL
jgi:hypothetical protein